MPILKDFRQTKILTLPNWPDSQVEVYDSILIGQSAQIDWKNTNQVEVGVQRLLHHIKSWNFTDDKEQPLLITRENLNFLKEDDITYLIEEINKFGEERKKK